MLAKMNGIFRKIRAFFDPNAWMIRLLALSKTTDDREREGLILIQIDGLSHGHFSRAVQKDFLPFLSRLCGHERYRDWHHYSGVPSCTPAIQAELFYGVKQAVPAFKFRDHRCHCVRTFYHSSAARAVEERLEKKNPGLLAGGSSYGNIFSGGAKKNAHFCVASIGRVAFFKALNPFSLTVLILFNLTSIFRLAFLTAVEFFLAVMDCIRGTFQGYGFFDEFQFILSRVISAVGLRDLATLGAKLDIARGLPVIHVNFFGYDEQAHRRGPSSRFAYGALPGIDSCIRRIWNAAQNSTVRDYDVWIYSDHGQEEVIPYAVENGTGIEKAVETLFHEMLPGENLENLSVTAQGPVGFIYAHRVLTVEEKEKLARSLTIQKHVPLVLTKAREDRVYAFTHEGEFLLPQEAGRVLGETHPYLTEAAREMGSLTLHPDSGDFVISGWRKEGRPVSFPREYGSHAGPGLQETDGFALLPRDIHLDFHDRKNYLRPSDLRHTAQGFLHGIEKTFFGTDPARPGRRALRVMTYNTHSGIGMDGQLSLRRIARVIARHDPDVIALQELDAGRIRTRGVHQAEILSELLDMEYHFHAVRAVEEEMYGNAVLSRYPLKIIEAGSLPRIFQHRYFEPRGALWVEIEYLDVKIQLVNTHLSFWGPEKKKQAEALCGKDWLGGMACGEHVILCGDFNATPYSVSCRLIRETLEDVQFKCGGHEPLNTWFGHYPIGRIDHIFVSPGLNVLSVEVPATRLEKIASDHLPLIAELQVPAAVSLAVAK